MISHDITQRDPSPDELSAALCVAEDQKAGPQKKRKHVRAAAGDVWVDPTLDEWPDSTCLHISVSFCLFVLRNIVQWSFARVLTFDSCGWRC